MIKILKIKDSSMSSSLNEGDIVLTLSKKIVPLRIGDDIVFKDDVNGLVIKKIIRNGFCFC